MRALTLPRITYNYFIQKWFLSALLLTISSHWFVILKIYGQEWGLISNIGKMTSLANFITWPLFSLSIIFASLKCIADKYNDHVKNNGQFVLERMLQSVNAVTSAKMRRFCEYIEANHDKKQLHIFRDITQPKYQVERIMENIQITLSEIFGINRDDIGLSVLYKFDDGREWSWLYRINTTGELDLKTLLEDPNTTVRQLIDRNQKSLFLPNKQVGITNGQYVAGPKDGTYDTTGSILCRNISIGQDKKYVHAILNITTYGKQLCEHTDKDSISKIQNLVISTFEKRLQLELSLLYAKEVMNPKCVKCLN